MSLNFVKSSILSSTDGIDFNSETLLDSEEAKRNREAGNQGYVKPLYLQLAEKKAEEDEAKDMMFKLNRAQPPVLLNDDDVLFLNDAMEQKKEKERKNNEELLEFKMKKEASKLLQDQDDSSKKSSYFSTTKSVPTAPKPTLPIIMVKRKRKDESEAKTKTEAKTEPEDKTEPEAKKPKETTDTAEAITNPLDLFSAYASDSE